MKLKLKLNAYTKVDLNTIRSIESIEINQDNELVITYTDGTSVNLGKIVGQDGVSVANATINSDNELILQMSDSTECCVGNVKGEPGVSIKESTINDDGELILILTDSTELNAGKVLGEDGIGIKEIFVNEDNEIIIKYTNGNSTNLGAIVVSSNGSANITGITKSEINANGELVIIYSDGNSDNVGKVVGNDGKTAYESAVDGGYQGSENEFNTKLAKNYVETESDPTVPSWAKQPNKPTYTADEVGALPKGTPIPSVEGLAKETYVDSKTSESITSHNTSTETHNDIRLLIEGISDRLNGIADSDDTTLDQLSEIVAYIKANKGLIDSITTSKINYDDIIDNLITSVSNKPLSAKQGVELKKLIDALSSSTTDNTNNLSSLSSQVTGLDNKINNVDTDLKAQIKTVSDSVPTDEHISDLIDIALGDVNTLLDGINGEVI